MEKFVQRAKTLIEALPYIKKFNSKTIVFKYGGSIGSKDFSNFARDIVLMKLVGINPVIVHGGGAEISKVLESLKIESNFIDGLRVTCPKTMEVVEMVLGGKVNKEIVSKIIMNGGKSVGISGKDGGFLRVKKVKASKKSQDLGRVGEITKVDIKLITELQDNGYIPVVAPIGSNNKGVSYNINADHAASKIASSLKAEKLIILTDVPGIQDEKRKLISSITKKTANSLIRKGVIAKGMVPKVKCLVQALMDGVNKAHIIDGRIPHAVILETFTDSGIGTEILL